jgi:hypothetical protein
VQRTQISRHLYRDDARRYGGRHTLIIRIRRTLSDLSPSPLWDTWAHSHSSAPLCPSVPLLISSLTVAERLSLQIFLIIFSLIMQLSQSNCPSIQTLYTVYSSFAIVCIPKCSMGTASPSSLVTLKGRLLHHPAIGVGHRSRSLGLKGEVAVEGRAPEWL